jgi:AsmA protein
LSIGKVTLDIAKAQLGATALSGSLSTALSANLEEQIFELAKIDASLTVANPQMPMKSLKLPITGSARADLGKQSAGFDIATRFDDSSITARAGVVRFSQPVINFDINIDRLDVDRYFPPQAAPAGKGGGAKAAAGAGKPIDLSALKGLNANGTLKIGALQVNNIKAANVVLTLKAAGGRVAVKPLGAALYQGKLAGTLGADASNPGAYAAWQTFTMVNFSH